MPFRIFRNPFFGSPMWDEVLIPEVFLFKINDNARIAKVKVTHGTKYYFDRHKKSIKLDSTKFNTLIKYLKSKDYTHLSVKYGVNSDYKKENFTLYFGGLKIEVDKYIQGDFVTEDLESRIALIDLNTQNDNFKNKNQALVKDGFSEFDECQMGGIAHEFNKVFDAWLDEYNLSACSIGLDNNPSFFGTNCKGKALTSVIFEGKSKNFFTRIFDFIFTILPFDNVGYADRGTGCCP
jgi:hypothetical protein